MAKELLREMSEKGRRPGLVSYNTLIDGLLQIKEAQQIFMRCQNKSRCCDIQHIDRWVLQGG
jgi:hypothetical protein